MLYNIRLQEYKSTDFDSVDLPGCNLSSCGRGTRKLISLKKILKRAKTESLSVIVSPQYLPFSSKN